MGKKLVITIIFTTLALAGCAGSGPGTETIRRVFPGETIVPREANRISLPAPEDRTGNPALAEKLHMRMVSLFAAGGRLAVVQPGEDTDLELKTTIISIQVQPVAVNTLGQVTRKRIRITASIVMRNIKAGAVILRDDEIQAFREYSDLVPPIESDDMALETVIDSLAGRIVTKAEKGWYTPLLTPQERRK